MSVGDVVSLYEYIVLKPEEDLVIQALKTIEPTIERIATTSRESRYYRGYPGERGGIVVKCAGVDQRIPIGSLGDGIWRMLGLALALVHAEPHLDQLVATKAALSDALLTGRVRVLHAEGVATQ